jgi:hypothetical protein
VIGGVRVPFMSKMLLVVVDERKREEKKGRRVVDAERKKLPSN